MIKPDYIIKPLIFVNTLEFSRAAQHFVRFGKYTLAKEGTLPHKEFWDEEEKRCKEGYTVGGVRITGEHYAYLNYARIRIKVDEGTTVRKYEGFPRFLDMDYYYYHELENARTNMQGIIVAKSRRKGFSYKGAFNLVYEYNWIRESFSIISAFMGEYANTTMGMALEMINFINKNTDWAKRKLIDTRTHIKSGFKEKINEVEVESGFRSEIISLSFKDNPFKSIGKSAGIMLFEEAGKWPGLIEAYMLSKPLFYDGDVPTGIPIIYGTGGDMEGGTQDFCDIFYKPSAFGLRAYENIWDENAVGECGWFVDDAWYKEPHVDKEGNSNRQKALDELDLQRENLRKAGNKRAYEKFVTQNPKTPAEAFLRTTGNIFPVADLLERLSYLESNQALQDKEWTGELVFNAENNVEFKINPKLFPIKQFPLKSDAEKDGCVVIFEHPYTGENGEITPGRYVAGIDPYQQDQAAHSTSLGSCFIFDRLTSRIVAEYTGRPPLMRDFHEQVRRLLIYYRAKALYENQIKGIMDYFSSTNSTYLLADEPTIIHDIIKKTSVNRKKGMHMVPQLSEYGEELIKEWLLSPSTDEGVSNLAKIRSIPLLKELISYDPDPEKNFDRVIALMFCLYMGAEKRKQRVEDIENARNEEQGFLSSDFFKTGFKRGGKW